MKRSELEFLIINSMKNNSNNIAEKFLADFKTQISKEKNQDEIFLSAMIALSTTTMEESIKIVFDILEQMGIVSLDD